VSPAAVEEDIDAVEDFGAQLGLRRPGTPVDKFFFSVAKKLSATALS
jgi:hypothetical protein